MIELFHDTPIRSKHWYNHITAKTFTLRGYCAKEGLDYAIELQRSIDNGHDIASSGIGGSTLYGNHEAAQRAMQRDMVQAASAVILATGDRVLIEGVEYIVFYPSRNETGKSPVNSDPIHFKPVS